MLNELHFQFGERFESCPSDGEQQDDDTYDEQPSDRQLPVHLVRHERIDHPHDADPLGTV